LIIRRSPKNIHYGFSSAPFGQIGHRRAGRLKGPMVLSKDGELAL
jgi:hypothetical protein